MSIIDTLVHCMEFNRTRTLGLLDKAEQDALSLAWRPGVGRAHIAWQLLHIGVTEEIFATERLMPSKTPQFAELLPRFKGGSTPDDQPPSAQVIRQVLQESRAHLLDTLRQFSDAQLDFVPPALQARNINLLGVLHILNWHEAHHQGQAHITFNLYQASK